MPHMKNDGRPWKKTSQQYTVQNILKCTAFIVMWDTNVFVLLIVGIGELMISKLVYRLDDAKALHETMLSQFEYREHKYLGEFQCTYISLQENAMEYDVWKSPTILSRPQWFSSSWLAASVANHIPPDIFLR